MKASEVRDSLLETGVTPSKRMGQHFLLWEDLAHRMVEYADIQPGDTVLEVGPGLGILTEKLRRRTDRVVAVEKDPRLCAFITRKFPDLLLLEGDVLRVSLPPFDKVVSNLPYEISSPFTFMLLGMPFERAVLTYQREFAKRMVARSGTKAYSRLSVNVHYRCNSRALEEVPRSAFWPVPEVDSTVVQLDPRSPPFHVDREGFHQVVDALFTHRRKKAVNALIYSWSQFARSKERLKSVLAGTALASKRAQELSPEHIAELTNLIFPPKG